MSKGKSDVRYGYVFGSAAEGGASARMGAIALALGLALGGAAAAVVPAAALAQGADARPLFSIPAGSLRDALDAMAAQSGATVLYSPELVAGKTTRGLSGRHAPAEALRNLLKDSGLQAQDAGDATFTVGRAPAAAPAPVRPAQPQAAAGSAAAAPEVQQLQSMTVTGSRIRGGSTPSPVITIDSARIQEEGFTDLGEVIRSIPQNFSGGQNPGVAVGATAGAGGLANQNVTGGSSLNLRGLGPDATLTLLNGRRLSYGGFVQAVDISAIPVEAVERIEIVPDGASAIYGSDAVGGVGNVILKRDYDGAKAGWRYGGATDGGLSTREYTATAGTTWASGGLLATFQDTSTDPIYARQRDYTRQMFDPSTLYPGSDLRSGLISVHQSVGHAVELRLDALRTTRHQDFYPWNTGLVPYYYRVTPETTTSLVSPSAEIALAGDWTLTVGGSWGRDRHLQQQSQVDIPSGVSRTMLRQCYCNRASSYEVGAEGPLFQVTGGDVRLAVGAGGRKNDFTQSDLLTGTDVIQGEERSRFAYAEFDFPLVGPNQAIAGIRRLEVTAAVRAEDYDSFGSVTTPKVGLIYGPGDDFTVKASWGKSFKAPTLYQRYQASTVYLDPASSYGGAADGTTVLARFGGDHDLDAEHATTRTVSLAFHPDALRGLEAELTWFDIDYTDRVVQPITDYAHALTNPDYAQFVDRVPTMQTLEDVIASAGAFYNYSGGPYDPGKVVAVLSAQYVNVARQRIKGVDLSSSYRFDLGAGRMTVRGSATWLDSTQQNVASGGSYDVAGTLFNPARLGTRFGAVWDQGSFSASTFANYTAGVTDQANRLKTASFTTVDATLRYAADQHAGMLSGLEFVLTVQNLLDRDPPLYVATSPDRPPYDSTNYSAIGRFMSVSVSKRW